MKTVKFKEPKYVGDPVNAVRIFNEKEVDELLVIDIDATKNGTEPDYKVIQHLAKECRMPLCYGGGIKTVEQASRIISLGVEKVAISSAAVRTPELVTEIAGIIGRQSVVIVIDVRKRTLGTFYDVFTHNGTRKIGITALDLARKMAEAGAGEIVLNAIDRDGVMKGYDLALARQLRDCVSTPISFLGGAGTLEDISTLIETVGVVGAVAGSLFVFKGRHRAVLINYPQPDAREIIVKSAMGYE